VTAAGRRELRRWLAVAPRPRGKDETLVRVAFLDAMAPAERRAALLGHERALGEEARRLRSAPAAGGFRERARRAVLEKLETERRWLRGITAEPAEAGAPASPVWKKK